MATEDDASALQPQLQDVPQLAPYVGALNRTFAFYEALQFELGRSGGNHARYSLHNATLEFIEADSESLPDMKQVEMRTPRGGGVVVRIRCKDIHNFRENANRRKSPRTATVAD